MSSSTEDQRAIELFREYLRIKSVHPNPDYAGAVEFLRQTASDRLNIDIQSDNNNNENHMRIIECSPGLPMLLITIPGSDPSLPSILLNSHTDVVPVDLAYWKVDPFAAERDEEGNIYGRGAQDMKSVTIQHLEAIRRIIINNNQKLLRTIHLSFVPDEEIGGSKGLAKWIETEQFQSLNVGLALDEGLANSTDAFTVFYGERAAWWVNVIATGNAGHGSRFIQNTAIEKLVKVLNQCIAFRTEQEKILLDQPHSCGKKLGDVITLNLTILQAGSQHNVVPTEARAGLDIRIPPTVNLQEFEQTLASWCSEDGVKYEFFHYTPANAVSDISTDSFWWNALTTSCSSMSLKLEPEIFPAATDSRYLRLKNIPAFGFSPMNNTPVLLHDHNEFLNEQVFLRGIGIFEKLISDLANTPARQ